MTTHSLPEVSDFEIRFMPCHGFDRLSFPSVCFSNIDDRIIDAAKSLAEI